MKRTRKGDGKVAIGYLRVSTEDQRLGPEAQRAAIEAWAAREGVTVAAWFTDQGVHGDSDLDERPGLVAALAALREHRAGLLVVYKRDRIARDAAVAALIDRAAGQCGARIVAADGVANGDAPADLLLRGILDSVAGYELSLIRTRTRAALRAKRARGECAGEVPYGYRLGADGTHLEADAAEQAVIARARDLRVAGLTLHAIVEELARAGAVSRSGRPLGLTQVARIVKAAA